MVEIDVPENAMSKPRIFVAVQLADDLLARLEERCDVQTYPGPHPIPTPELTAGLAQAAGVLANPLIPFPASVIDAAPALRAIANVGVGYDNVDLIHASARGITVANTPGMLTDAVADCVMAMILSVARRLPDCEASVRSGQWGRDVPLGLDLKDKTLALIGYGRIGWEVAARARAFKMRVAFYEPRADVKALVGVERVESLETALHQADFVSLHVDLNPTTRHLIDSRALACMKPTAFLINTSRGAVVDQPALCAALSAGTIAGAALDVLEEEPPNVGDPILACRNVLILPHVGSGTIETRRAMAELAVSNLIACVHGESCDCIVTEAKRSP